MNERLPIGTVVYTVVASNEDPAAVMSYTVAGGTAAAALAISPSGVVTVTNSTFLRYAYHKTGVTLTVTAALVGSPGPGYTSTADVQFDLVEVIVAPNMNALTVSVAENSPVGTAVGSGATLYVRELENTGVLGWLAAWLWGVQWAGHCYCRWNVTRAGCGGLMAGCVT